jgi:hypothetical protein
MTYWIAPGPFPGPARRVFSRGAPGALVNSFPRATGKPRPRRVLLRRFHATGTGENFAPAPTISPPGDTRGTPRRSKALLVGPHSALLAGGQVAGLPGGSPGEGGPRFSGFSRLALLYYTDLQLPDKVRKPILRGFPAQKKKLDKVFILC